MGVSMVPVPVNRHSRGDGDRRLATAAGAARGLPGLFRLDLAEFSRTGRLRAAIAVRLKAALGLGWFLGAFSPGDRLKVSTPDDVGQRLSVGGTPAENPRTVVAAPGLVRVGARRSVLCSVSVVT